MPDPRIDEAIALMNRFAERTGLASEQPQRRYLWTDAFAVCNYLGLAIGLHAMEYLYQAVDHESEHAATSPRLRAQLQALMRYLPLRDEIEAIWRDPEQQRSATWIEHQDINEVMLATSLAPDGFLVLLPRKDRD